MEQIKLKLGEICQLEEVIPLHEIDLKKNIVPKENFKLYWINYIVKTKKIPLRIGLKWAYDRIHNELYKIGRQKLTKYSVW